MVMKRRSIETDWRSAVTFRGFDNESVAVKSWKTNTLGITHKPSKK